MASHSLADQLPLLPLLVPLLLLPLLHLLLIRSKIIPKTNTVEQARRAPPGPPKQLPVLGDLLQIGSRPHRYFQAVARRYGPVVQVQLGRLRTVVVSSPEAAKEVLRTNDVHCCSRPDSPGKLIMFWAYYFL
jgi:4-hydroxyphenylacetaldehyde oxime monooxygenase